MKPAVLNQVRPVSCYNQSLLGDQTRESLCSSRLVNLLRLTLTLNPKSAFWIPVYSMYGNLIGITGFRRVSGFSATKLLSTPFKPRQHNAIADGKRYETAVLNQVRPVSCHNESSLIDRTRESLRSSRLVEPLRLKWRLFFAFLKLSRRNS